MTHPGRPPHTRCAVCCAKRNAPCVLTLYDIGAEARYAILAREQKAAKKRKGRK